MMKKATLNWIQSSNYDIETAVSMLKSKRFVYVIFMCHLATEKMLKALVSEAQANLPPKTHDLLFLIRLANLTLPPQYQRIVNLLNTASIPTRYPEDISAISKVYNARKAKSYLTQTIEALNWLKELPQLQR